MGQEDFGAIGVSAGSVEEDMQVAAAGANAIFMLDTMVHILMTEMPGLHPIQVLYNPFNDQLLLQTANTTYHIFIYDTQGKQYYEGLLNGNLQINTSKWVSGMYVLKVMYDGMLVGGEEGFAGVVAMYIFFNFF